MTRDVERGRQRGPDLDLQADMFEWSLDRMARGGFHHYEISNWSRADRECRHNLVYWRNGDWLGLGAGAHSHLLGERFADAASPRRYIELVGEAARAHEREGASSPPSPRGEEGQAGEASPLDVMRQVVMREPPDTAREMAETAFLALRLREGLDIKAFKQRFGVDIIEVFRHAVEETQALGLTELVEGRLRVKDEAVLLGDEAFVRFLEPSPVEA
jgi:oxygen-independent coproporphyrinogen-3 oxidase